jgi:hypothetical protein
MFGKTITYKTTNHSWDFIPYKLCTSSGSEFLKFVGPKGAEFRQVRQNPHTWRFYCLPNIFCCFVCNGFAKHVLWLLISCLTDCLCNLGSKYNDRICLRSDEFQKLWTRGGTQFIWDEVPTMVEIAIFWFQIHITNGLNFMHPKSIHG